MSEYKNFKEIYDADLKDAELAKALRKIGYSFIDYCNWMDFQRAMGRI